MYCSCSQRSSQWMPNEYNNTLPVVSKSRESLTHKKSSLKNPSRPGSITSSKKSVDICPEPRFSTLPRSSSRIQSKSPHVSTIFKNDSVSNLHHHSSNNRQRRRSEVIPWHQKPADALQCTCRNSCYFCQLNYPKVNYPLSTSSNALNTYHLPISTLSLNHPNCVHRSHFDLSTNSIQQQPYTLPNKASTTHLHHHSMINLNNIHHEATQQSPEMSDTSPIPAPPIPPLNPSCARCRFTATTGSNGTINCSQNCNTHVHAGLSQQNSLSGFAVTATQNNVVNCYPGELKYFPLFSICKAEMLRK